jgi:REP element-mobilizing transposase RayT
MPRRPRRELPDPALFHVTARGVNRSLIAHDEVDLNALRKLVLAAAKRFGWEYDAYCLLNAHFHLVMPAGVASLSAGMHLLMGTYAQRINRRYERRGHLFENRFSVWVVRDEDHWIETCRYVLDNPVKAGLCATAHDWPWSGGRFFRDHRP